MTINHHASEFAGRPVEDFDRDAGITDPSGTALALRIGYDTDRGSILDELGALCADPWVYALEALVIGCWEDAYDSSSQRVIRALADASGILKGLKALFIGDIYFEECEISWINQSDLSPLLEAFEGLELLCARGGTDLSLARPRHARLQSLILQTGGLNAGVVQQLSRAHLPALTHLELWLGTPDYGGTTEIRDLMPILSGRLFPSLRSLSLKNAAIADDIARAIVGSPIIHQIEALDLSMGTLSDEGAEILGTHEALTRLKRLDVSRNYLSDTMIANLRGGGINLVADDQGDPDEGWRYCSVAE